MIKRLAVAAAAVTIAASTPAYAGQWVQDSVGWRWQFDDGSYNKSWGWAWIDGNHDGIAENYYFGENRYLSYDVADQGVTVNENGALLHNGAVATDVIPDGSDYFSGMAENGKIWYITFTPDESVHELNAKIQAEKEQKEAEKERKKEQDREELIAWGESLDTYEIAYHIANMVNQERAKQGYEEISVNDELMENAMVRAQELKERMGHVRPDGSSAFTAVTVDAYAIGENVAQGTVETGSTEEELADQLFRMWLYSKQGHKQTMLNSRNEQIGVGVHIDGASIYACQLFTE